MKFIERLKYLRSEKNMNQTQAAKLLESSQTAYSKWELVQREMPLSKMLIL